MIRIENLGKSFGETHAVSGLNVTIERGEVFGILGPNGAGKTTTVRMLTALIGPTTGSAWVNGYQIGNDNQAIRASVGVLTETPGLYKRLTAVENLRLFGRLHGVEGIDNAIQRYLEMLDLWDRRDEPVGGFSKGMRQKVAIARALMHEPPVVFLDEPTAALDPASAKVIRQFVETLSDEGRTVVICTHNLDEADRLCDRIGILKREFLKIDSPDAMRHSMYGRSVLISLAESDPELIDLVKKLAFVDDVSLSEHKLEVALENPARDNPELVRALVQAGAQIQFVEEIDHSLEKVYLDLIGGNE